LIEVVLVIAIVAVIAGAALMYSLGSIEDARLSRALSDAEMIGIAIHAFIQDTGFAPAFKQGDEIGPDGEIYRVLETLGSEPGMADGISWPTDEEERDLLEHHLIKNAPGGSGAHYRRIGQLTYDRTKGWNGPYIPRVPSADPWGNKYLVNVQLLTPKGVNQAVGEEFVLETGQRPAAFTISAGPNRQIDTRFDQIADSFVAGGDDIVFRIQ
jgi:type II secretory pathway pseudopilin PulG